ncbi:MAG: hypothetical protein RL701_5002 [Pseudomonadota bacterium]|jgi:MYXO-CTERM domain-containing protein
MFSKHCALGALSVIAGLSASHAHAHIKLLQPASWLTEDELGGPQKGSPCGPGNARPFLGDDVQPTPFSKAVTTFKAGETIHVAWQETVYHPGYFRISIAPTGAAAATTSDFPDPALTDLENCRYDRAAVQTVPHGNVLADGLFMAESQDGTGRSLMQDVVLPNQPCEHCTLQVVQVMEGHPAASCFYFHCAELEIVAADSSNAGAAAPTSLPSVPENDKSGCSVAKPGEHSASAGAWGLLVTVGLLFRRRIRHPRRG